MVTGKQLYELLSSTNQLKALHFIKNRFNHENEIDNCPQHSLDWTERQKDILKRSLSNVELLNLTHCSDYDKKILINFFDVCQNLKALHFSCICVTREPNCSSSK